MTVTRHILDPIAKLALRLDGLTSDTGDVLQRILTATPFQPQFADFPAMIIEMDPEAENSAEVHTLGGGHLVYSLNVMILVGVPAADVIEELHNKACAWVYPLLARIVGDISLGGDILMMGYGGVDTGQEPVFKWRIQGISWNQQEFYGLRVTLPLKEDLTIPMG